MNPPGFALFDTAIGRCGIAWGDRGLLGVQLPEGKDADTRARLVRQFPDGVEGAPPPRIARAIGAMAALLQGKAVDLSDVPLDMDRVPPFHQRVYQVARGIPPGATLSYGDIAARLGMPGSARAVGQALGRNPFAIVVPCHRVLAANGRMGGFSANGGIVTKLRMLTIEGVHAADRTPGGDEPLGFDPDQAVAHLRAADPTLARLIDRIGPLRLRRETTPSIFAALARSIVFQQLNGRAAATIFARVCALFPRPHEPLSPQRILRASDARLRAAGLSQSKLLSLRDLARRQVAGEIPTLAEVRDMDDQTIIDRLTPVRGIGQWTVEMLLIFRLGRPDVLPVDDFGVRKGFAVAFKKKVMPTPQELEKRGERWRPFRTAASWYLWRAADLVPGPLVKT